MSNYWALILCYRSIETWARQTGTLLPGHLINLFRQSVKVGFMIKHGKWIVFLYSFLQTHWNESKKKKFFFFLIMNSKGLIDQVTGLANWKSLDPKAHRGKCFLKNYRCPKTLKFIFMKMNIGSYESGMPVLVEWSETNT